MFWTMSANLFQSSVIREKEQGFPSFTPIFHPSVSLRIKSQHKRPALLTFFVAVKSVLTFHTFFHEPIWQYFFGKLKLQHLERAFLVRNDNKIRADALGSPVIPPVVLWYCLLYTQDSNSEFFGQRNIEPQSGWAICQWKKKHKPGLWFKNLELQRAQWFPNERKRD